MKVLSVITVILFHVIVIRADRCFKPEEEQLDRHFSTKTPYRVIANKDDLQPITFEGCTAVRNWAVIRHGTRNPSAKVIRAMNTDLYKFKDQIIRKSHLCDKDKKAFTAWESYLNEDEEKNLVAEGEDELIELGERYQMRFPDLLSEQYDNSTYKFKFTATERTERSAKGFATGLFGRENLRQIWYHTPLHRDPILRFYKLCNTWRKNVKKNPDTFKEIERFVETEIVQAMIKDLRIKTGISELTFHDIQTMYETCAFETAWWKKKESPWCTLFTKDSIKILEFAEDLEYFWKDGYGYEITYSQACPAIKDLVQHLQLDSPQPASTFYFTHSGTVLKLLAALDLYRDEEKLFHTEFSRPRKWRTSEIDAFASNLMFVSFNCSGEAHLLAMHQERIIRLPGCPQDKDLCPLTTFIGLYREQIENCRFNEICESQ